MPATPNITLTATLDTIAGVAVGTTADQAKLRIALCGFGSSLPRIAGTSIVAPGPTTLFSPGTAFSTAIWGNDQITPAGTYYSIELLDGQDNVVQCGAYQLTGSGTFDLSSLTPIVFPGQAGSVPSVIFSSVPTLQNGTGAINSINTAFTFAAPPAPTPVIAVFVAGIYQDPLAPASDYTVAYSGSNTWTITFTVAPAAGPVTLILFQLAGAPTRTITAPTTINVTGVSADNTILCNFSIAGAITVPSPATAGIGYELTFIDISYAAATKNITLNGTINNGASYVINTNGGAVTMRSDGTAWRIKSKF
jgi:hypothetical protein